MSSADSNSDSCSAAIAVLRAAYPNATIPQETIDLYRQSLSNHDGQVLLTAVRKLVLTAKFFPTIAEITAEAASEALGIPSPEEAWQEVLDRAGNGVENQRTIVSDALKSIGGLYEVRMSTNIAVHRSQFLKAYADVSQRETVHYAIHGQSKYAELTEGPTPKEKGLPNYWEDLSPLPEVLVKEMP